MADTGSGITYRLEKQINNGTWTLVPGAAALPSSTTSFADSGSYNDGDVVRYHVHATNGAGLVGEWRESDGMTIDTGRPATPAWVREDSPTDPDRDYHPDADGAITVYWAAVNDTGSGITYRLEKRVNGGTWTTVAANLAGTSYPDSGSYADNDFIEYQVVAVNRVLAEGTPRVSHGMRIDTGTPLAPAAVGEGDVAGSDDDFDENNAFYVFWTAPGSTGSGLTYTVERSRNGSVWEMAGSSLACTTTPCQWDDPVPFSNGDTLQYRVMAVNGAGHTSSPSLESDGITIDTAQPDSAVATNGFFNSFNWPGSVVGTASDAGSDVAFVDIQIQRSSNNQYWDGSTWTGSAAWLRTTGMHNWQYALALAALTDGVTYDVRSRATDNAGNVEATYGFNSFTFASSGPAAPSISSSTHPVQTNWYNHNNPAFTWTPPPAGGTGLSVVGYSYILDQNASTMPDNSAETAGNTASFSGVADGTSYLHVRAVNSAGNWGPAAHYRINIDTERPVAPASITEENPDVDWDADGSLTVYWSAVTDTGSGITYRLERQVNGGTWTLVPGAGALSATSYPVSGFANGNRVLFRVQPTNGAGLSSLDWATSDGVTIDTSTPGTPTGVGEGDVAGIDDDWDQDNLFYVYWTAVSGAPSGITYSVERSRNGGDWEQVVSGVQGTFWEDSTAYGTGESVAYRVTAHTGAGRSGSASTESDGLTLDFVRPDSVIETSGFYNATTWPGSIRGTATDDLSDVASVEITLRRRGSGNLYWDGSDFNSVAPVWLLTTGSANWQYPFAPADGMTYDVQSRATDNATNVETTLDAKYFSYVGNELSITLDDGRDTVQPGERITYTISYYSPFAMNNGRVQIDIPANTSFVNASVDYERVGDTVRWWLPPQEPGFSGQRQLVVDLDPVLDNGLTIGATAFIIGDGQSNSASDEDTVVSQPDLAASLKTVSNPGARPGQTVTYRIALTNMGTMHAYSARITDTIPADMTYQGNLVASSGAAVYENGDVRWSGAVNVGTPVEITFEAVVKDTVLEGTHIENVVFIDDGVSPVLQRSAVIEVGAGAPMGGTIYLPFVGKAAVNVVPPGAYDIELTITNCGDTPAVGAFWVDLYFNPDQSKAWWPISHGEGYDWFGKGAGFIVSSLGAGQSYTLHLSDAVQKKLPAQLNGSPQLYGQVDWVDMTTPGMGVVDEGSNGEKNNVAGPSGGTCSAVRGRPDLVVESIRVVTGDSAQASSGDSLPTFPGEQPAPPRPGFSQK